MEMLLLKFVFAHNLHNKLVKQNLLLKVVAFKLKFGN